MRAGQIKGFPEIYTLVEHPGMVFALSLSLSLSLSLYYIVILTVIFSPPFGTLRFRRIFFRG
jgi:hypothetical protein